MSFFNNESTNTDKWVDAVNNAQENPYNITTEPSLIPDEKFPNLESVFAVEIVDTLDMMYKMGQRTNGRSTIGGYLINLIDSYYQNAGYVPKTIVDEIMRQVYNAVKAGKYAYMLDSLEQLRDGVYPALLSNK